MVKIETLLRVLTYGACLLGVAPLYPWLDLTTRIVFPAAWLGGIFFDRGRRYLFTPGLATILSIVLFTVYALQINLANLVDPAVNILTLLLAIRLVTEKSARNTLQIFVLAVFALASSTLLTLSGAFFIYLVLQVFFVTIGLVLLSFHQVDSGLRLSRRDLRSLLGTALILPAVSLLLMLLFFAILPRTQHPLWNFLNPRPDAVAGFTEQVSPGSLASISAVKRVAFRADSPRLPAEQLYWRGIVLNGMDGQTWRREPVPRGERTRITGGRPVRQTIYPRSKDDRYLLALDPPREIEGIRTREAADLVFTARRSLDRQVRYETVSVVGGKIELIGDFDYRFYLRVPEGLSERVRNAAARIRDEGETAEERIGLLQNFFRDRQLSYATTDLPGAAAPIDQFLFEKKRGYCEFFASSFAAMLRLSGVPARLIGGYFGGDYNALGGYYVVTEDTAHVWVEALVDGRWRRIDPSRLAQNAGTDFLAQRDRGLNAGRKLLDAASYLWNQTVINYDLRKQLQLFRRANVQLKQVNISGDLRRMTIYLLPALGVVGVIFLWRRRYSSAEQRILRSYLRKVGRIYGIPHPPPGSGLHDLARTVDDPCCREFTAIYGRAVYRDRFLTREERRRLRQLIDELGRNRKPGAGEGKNG